MEAKDLEQLEILRGLSKSHFKMLHQEGTKRKVFKTSITVGGYTDLMYIVTDLIKASLLALEAKEPFASREIRNPASNVCGLLDLALQLIPHEEIEVLDVLHGMGLEEVASLRSQ